VHIVYGSVAGGINGCLAGYCFLVRSPHGSPRPAMDPQIHLNIDLFQPKLRGLKVEYYRFALS
jgi:hypothetical protein